MTKKEIVQRETIRKLRKELARRQMNMDRVVRYARDDTLATIAAIMQKE